MGTRLLLLADTHWPRRARALPDEVWRAVAAADVVVHAGDWVEEAEGLRVAVVHETGAAQGRERRMDRTYPDVDVLVFGHSHIPWDTVTPRGMRLLNPGSPTDRRRQPFATYMTVNVEAGAAPAALPVELHRLPSRSPGATR